MLELRRKIGGEGGNKKSKTGDESTGSGQEGRGSTKVYCGHWGVGKRAEAEKPGGQDGFALEKEHGYHWELPSS